MPSKQSTTRSGRVSKSTQPAYPRRSSSTTHEGPIARALRRHKSAQAASKSLAREHPRMDPPTGTPKTDLAPTSGPGHVFASPPTPGTQPPATATTVGVDEKPEIHRPPPHPPVTSSSTLHASPHPASSAPLDYFPPLLPLHTTPTLAASRRRPLLYRGFTLLLRIHIPSPSQSFQCPCPRFSTRRHVYCQRWPPSHAPSPSPSCQYR